MFQVSVTALYFQPATTGRRFERSKVDRKMTGYVARCVLRSASETLGDISNGARFQFIN